MPLAGLFLLHVALGLAAARVAARELRASPRAVVWTRAFGALALHEAVVGVPATLYLLLRHADWMVSYVVEGARIPSALSLVAAVAQGAAALGGFALGARWLRAHHPRRVAVAAAALAGAALVGVLALKGRVGVVGSYAQFRGGFGLQGLWGSRAFGALAALGAVSAAALAHLFWTVRARL